MTDLEMIKRCAEKMGLHKRDDGIYYADIDDWSEHYPYDPLHDDAQAMALVKKFKLNVRHFADETVSVFNAYDSAKNSDLNRAIVECVAKLN